MGSARSLARAVEWWLTQRMVRLVGKTIFWLKGHRDERTSIDLAQIKTVLVLRLDEIGDVVLTLPLLRELKRNLPYASITLVVKPAIFNLVELCPYVDEVLKYEPPGARFWRMFQALSRALRLARNHLWKRDFDLAISPRWDVDSSFASMVVYLSGARQRLGYSELVTEEKSRLNVGSDRLFTHLRNESAGKHEVEKSLDLIRYCGGNVSDNGLELWLSDEDDLFADRFLAKHGLHSGDLLIAIAPGAGHPKRKWPISNFLELGEWFKQNYRGSLLVVGGKEERGDGQKLKLSLGRSVVDAAGQTTLRQAAALLKRCRLFVGNDAGPMHLAAAVGLPVVEVSCHPQAGSSVHVNSPDRFGPWGVPHSKLRPESPVGSCAVACDADEAHCILNVSVEQAKDALTALLPRQIASNMKHSFTRQAVATPPIS